MGTTTAKTWVDLLGTDIRWCSVSKTKSGADIVRYLPSEKRFVRLWSFDSHSAALGIFQEWLKQAATTP